MSALKRLRDHAWLHRYKSELENAADYINGKLDSPACALVLNLGPAWLRPDAYELFNNNVIEVPFKDWESPPGLGIVPLDVMFTVCSSMASWLQLNDEHVVVRFDNRPLLVLKGLQTRGEMGNG